VLLRITNMRGVNLSVFDFDFDLTWAALFMSADEHIYGRFGGRAADSADKYLTLGGLKHAMRAALAAHRAYQASSNGEKPLSRSVEQYPAAKRLKADACIHCHQVYDFRRQEKVAEGKWRQGDVWVYPLPENVGLSLAPESGSKVQAVLHDSPAERTDLRKGDELRAVNGIPVASFADVQYALNQAPASGSIGVSWQRGDTMMTGQLQLADGWRKTDISWRASMWGLSPAPFVHGVDLTAEEKKKLSLSEKALAFRQGQFVPPPAKMAGILAGDIIVGIDGKPLEMTMRQFNAYVRTNYAVGDQVKLNVIRNGERVDVAMTLISRP
jgi:serine protease Do